MIQVAMLILGQCQEHRTKDGLDPSDPLRSNARPQGSLDFCKETGLDILLTHPISQMLWGGLEKRTALNRGSHGGAKRSKRKLACKFHLANTSKLSWRI